MVEEVEEPGTVLELECTGSTEEQKRAVVAAASSTTSAMVELFIPVHSPLRSPTCGRLLLPGSGGSPQYPRASIGPAPSEHCTLGKSLNRNSREQSYIKW